MSITNGIKKISVLAQLLKTSPNLVTILKPGDLVEGTFIEKVRKSAFFDLGSLGTGIVYGSEFGNAQEVLKNIKRGDKISAKVLDPENTESYVELSLAAAGKQKAWQNLKELQEKGELLNVKVTGANSGGLLVEINDARGFLPISQLSSEHYPKVDDGDKMKIMEALKGLVGKQISAKIIDLNSRTNKLILSEREGVGENVKELLAKYKAGDIVDGIISGVADFGAFMRFADNPKVEGLIYISELEHRIIESPKEVVKVNDTVKAKILEIKDGRVSLSLKALKADPWTNVEKKVQTGQDAQGVVAKLYPYGALVNLAESGLQGMVHISDFGGVEEMKKQLEIGKTYTFKVDLIKLAEKRIILKMKK